MLKVPVALWHHCSHRFDVSRVCATNDRHRPPAWRADASSGSRTSLIMDLRKVVIRQENLLNSHRKILATLPVMLI
jgi:hypothetical protein